jgi:purine-binding chemotaxis protein CheW
MLGANTVEKISFRNIDPRCGKYLTFFLAGEEYGVEILKVREIIGLTPITPVPLTSGYIKGVINLRGKILPVMDLRIKFDMDGTRMTGETCVIVISTAGMLTGILVDRVSDVVSIGPGEIEDTPSFGADVNPEYLLGVGKTGDRVRLLLDIEKVIRSADIINMRKTPGAGNK